MSDSVYDIKDAVIRKGNPIPTVQYDEPIGTRKVCCMFYDPSAESAVENRDLEAWYSFGKLAYSRETY